MLSRLEAIATRLEARLEAIASRLEAIASKLEAIATRLEARLEGSSILATRSLWGRNDQALEPCFFFNSFLVLSFSSFNYIIELCFMSFSFLPFLPL